MNTNKSFNECITAGESKKASSVITGLIRFDGIAGGLKEYKSVNRNITSDENVEVQCKIIKSRTRRNIEPVE